MKYAFWESSIRVSVQPVKYHKKHTNRHLHILFLKGFSPQQFDKRCNFPPSYPPYSGVSFTYFSPVAYTIPCFARLGGIFLTKKTANYESPLRLLIQKIVKEELKKLTDHSLESTPQSSTSSSKDPILPSTHSDPYQSQSWAIFGTPEPDPKRTHIQKQQPRALPGWPELYRPDFTGFDSAPYIPKHPKTPYND
jgi:hypothetical protein